MGDRSAAVRRAWETRRGAAAATREKKDGGGGRRVEDADVALKGSGVGARSAARKVAKKLGEEGKSEAATHVRNAIEAHKMGLDDLVEMHLDRARTAAGKGELKEWAEEKTGKSAEPATAAERGAAPGGEHEKFGTDIAGKAIEGEKKFGGSANIVRTGKIAGHDVFVKPSVDMLAFQFDAKQAVAAHNTMLNMAKDLGMGHLLQPAALHTHAGVESFATKSAGAGFKPFHKIDEAEIAKNVPEGEKVAAAYMDFIHGNHDRHSGNALYNQKTKKMVLIDHDLTHGAGEEHGGAIRSMFFPGGHAGYQDRQDRPEHLPEKVRRVNREIHESSVGDVARKQGISEKEAGKMKERAAAVEKGGLTKAIEGAGGVSHRSHTRDWWTAVPVGSRSK